MRYLIIPDIHLRLDRVKWLLNKESYDKVIFLGDYFDSFKENYKTWGTTTTKEMALWLKENLKNENFIFLWGNHDAHYMIPNYYNGPLLCGLTKEKNDIINSILNFDDWKKGGIFHNIGKYIFSHAGINKDFIPAVLPADGSISYFLREGKSAMFNFLHPFWKPGSDRGFFEPSFGGPIWSDWSNIYSFDYIVQVVGHTIHGNVQYVRNCIDLDTNSRHYMLMENKDEFPLFSVEKMNYTKRKRYRRV